MEIEALNIQEQESVEESKESQENIEEEKKVYRCNICGKEFPSFRSLESHMRVHKKKKREEGVGDAISNSAKENENEIEEPELPQPWEVSVIEDAIKFLEETLPKVYGIEKYGRSIVDALRMDPRPLIDPNALHAFIKSLAPRVYDSHLATFVINPLYVKYPNLPQAVARYVQGTGQPMHIPPSYAPVVPNPAMPFYYPQSLYNPYPYPYPYYHQYYQTPPYPYISPTPPPKPLKTYKIVVDGQEIETDEAGYMAWQRFLREKEEQERRKQEHEMMMKKLEIEIKKALEGGEEQKKREEELNRKIEEISKKLEEERERRHQAELELVKRELEELKRRPGLLEELAIYEEIAKRLGFQRGGKTTLDLLESFIDRVDQRAAQLLNKIPTTETWKPEIKRTPEERSRKAEEIMKKLEKSEEILRAEEKLIKVAAKIKPRMVAQSGGEKA